MASLPSRIVACLAFGVCASGFAYLLHPAASPAAPSPLRVLHEFAWSDGACPGSSLALVDGRLYGTTRGGRRPVEFGTIWRCNLDGSGYDTLHVFDGDTVGSVRGGLTFDDGWLFGAGDSRDGQVVAFRIRPDGTGFRVLHRFDSLEPAGELVASGGRLFGLADAAPGVSFLYSLSRDGSQAALLRRIDGEARGLLAADGCLFGVAQQSLFRCALDGAGFTELHTAPEPLDDSLAEADGFLYAATAAGRLFRLRTDGSGLETLGRLNRSSEGTDLANGFALVAGGLYGASRVVTSPPNLGPGTLFRLSLDDRTCAVLHTFVGGPHDGDTPNGGLLHVDGALYGTTQNGGRANGGTLFAYALPTAESP